MRSNILRLAFAAAALSLFSVHGSNAQTSLSYAQYGPDRGWQSQAIKQFADDVSKTTDGKVQIRITWGGALIPTRDVLRGVGDGVADMGSFVGVMTPTELFNYRVGDLPVGSTDPWVGVKTMEDLVAKNKTIQQEFAQQNVIPIANFTTTEVVLSCREAITSLKQFEGLKMRTNPPHSLGFKEFGAVAVSVAITDVYQSLDRGLITCAQTYIPTIIPYRQYEVAKHVLILNFGQNTAYGVVMNKASFERLTPQQQVAVKSAGTKLTMAYARHSIEDVAQAKAKLTEFGVAFHKLSAVDEKKLQESSKVTVDAFLKKGDKSVLDDFIALTKHNEAALKNQGYPWAKK